MAREQQMERLARDRGPALVGYAYLLTGDLHAAQELVQEALIRTFSRGRPGVVVAAATSDMLPDAVPAGRAVEAFDDVVLVPCDGTDALPPGDYALWLQTTFALLEGDPVNELTGDWPFTVEEN